MNLHEYQSKALFIEYGINVPRGTAVESSVEAFKAAEEMSADIWVVKAQAHTGGRGKAGGVKLAHSLDEVCKYTDEMLGMTLVTYQTGPEGLPVNKVYIEEASEIERELYLSILVDRDNGRISFVASAEGGMSIEELAAEKPEAIKKVEIDPAVGLTGFQARELSFALDFPKEVLGKAVQLFMGCYKAMVELDMNMLEINPLVLTKDQNLVALDAKMSFDDNALFRHPEINELNDNSQKDKREVAASEHDLSYVGLDGDIGCMINGAGLAMATMDMIKYCGGEPANFLDIGGGASPERVGKAFELVLADDNVKAMLVNVYAGINRCDWIAEGLVKIIPTVDLKIPLIVRLSGTNVEEGLKIIKDSGLPIILADTLKDAAEKAVEAAKK